VGIKNTNRRVTALAYNIQGSSDIIIPETINPLDPVKRSLGEKQYELSNHLGNVLVTVSDRKLAEGTEGSTATGYRTEVLFASDYYPFGMQMPGREFSAETTYRYGFNGMEKDDELAGEGNSYTTHFRALDTRIGRWLSVDPLEDAFPWQSPYASMDNNPINLRDPLGSSTEEGECEGCPEGVKMEKGIGDVPMYFRKGTEVTHFETDFPAINGSNLGTKDARKGQVKSFTVPAEDMGLETTYYAFFNEDNGEFEGYRTIGGELYTFEAMMEEDFTSSNFDPSNIIGPVLVFSGQPILKKRFITPGSSGGTSIASKYLSKLPLTFNKPVPTPIANVKGGYRFAYTKSVGKAVARYMPMIGWVITAYDITNLLYEGYQSKKEFEEYVKRVVLDGDELEFHGEKAKRMRLDE
jgi:RHS repeat-associated protein